MRMGKAEEWEARSEERADEVSRALVRMGVMTHGQLTRLLGINPKSERDLIRRWWDRFEEQHNVAKWVASSRYSVPGNRVMRLVRLTDAALTEWAEREGIRRARNRVKPSMLAQTINMGEVLIALRRDGALYDEWDMMLPQDGDEGLHAWLVKQDDPDYRMGLFLLPTRLTREEQGKKGLIYHGVIRRVIQNTKIRDTLFLVPRKYYAVALRLLSYIEQVGGELYVLPFESFLENPGWYLDSLYRGESQQRASLIDVLRPVRKLNMPLQYQFAALVQLQDGRYRMIDTYTSGDVKRVQNWLRFMLGYQVPNTGQVAGADVYVFDETMREGLEAVLRMKSKKQFDVSMVEVHGWPEGMVKPKPAREASQDAFDEVDDSDIDWDAWLNEPW